MFKKITLSAATPPVCDIKTYPIDTIFQSLHCTFMSIKNGFQVKNWNMFISDTIKLS